MRRSATRSLIGIICLCSFGSVASAAGAPGARHEPATLAPAKIQKIDTIVGRLLAERHIAGAALGIMRDGRLLYAQGYGMADVATRVPVKADTRFLIASISKMFTATATMMLVVDAKLSLDAPLSRVWPDAPVAWHRATVRQLLNHTAGIPNFTDFGAPPCHTEMPETAYQAKDVLGEVACLPLDFEPGSDFRYSNTGYHLLGLIIERASGQTYERFLRERIFLPLGMTSTRMIAAPGQRDDRATGHVWRDGIFRRGPDLYPMVEMSAGGLASNVADLARFDGGLASERLLPRHVMESMWTPSGVGSAVYGLGFGSRPVADRRQIGHNGGGPSAATSFVRFIDDGVTVVILTNTGQPPATIQTLVGEIAAVVLEPRRQRRAGVG